MAFSFAVALCPGHGHREPGRAWDPGAVVGALGERELTGRVATLAAPIIRELGGEAIEIDGAGYPDEHEQAVDWLDAHAAPGVYLSLHANVGGGTYALVRPDYRSRAGRRAAASIGDALEDLPEIRSFRTDELYPTYRQAIAAGRHPAPGSDGQPDWTWWTRGWVCIAGMWRARQAPGVLVELGFLDRPEHWPLWSDDGLQRLAERLAAGCRAYALGEVTRSAA